MEAISRDTIAIKRDANHYPMADTQILSTPLFRAKDKDHPRSIPRSPIRRECLLCATDDVTFQLQPRSFPSDKSRLAALRIPFPKFSSTRATMRGEVRDKPDDGSRLPTCSRLAATFNA